MTDVSSLQVFNLAGQAMISTIPTGSAQEILANDISPISFKVSDNIGPNEVAIFIGGTDAAPMATNKLKVTKDDIVTK